MMCARTSVRQHEQRGRSYSERYRTSTNVHKLIITSSEVHYLGNGPVNVLRGVFDVARLAVQTILRVDDQTLLAVGTFYVLVDLGRAVSGNML